MWVDVRKKTEEKWARMCWFLYEHVLLSYLEKTMSQQQPQNKKVGPDV